MGGSRLSIESLYRLSLAEGEGIGTAYEYYAKRAKLNGFLRAVGRPMRILIAGLPEKYGFSMDFFMLAQELQAEVVAVDERAERVWRAQVILRELDTKGILRRAPPRFRVVTDLTDLEIDEDGGQPFDLALSCEVVQRLGFGRDRYFAALRQTAKNFAVFVPNGQNDAHGRHSDLRSVHLQDLVRHCTQGGGTSRIFGSGHLDMPPFPPGITRSQEKRDRAAESRLERCFMKALDVYCSVEPLWPEFIKARFAHIAYVMVRAAAVSATAKISSESGNVF